MKILSKFLFPSLILFVFTSFFILINPKNADAQTPGLNIRCSKDEARDNEFNYLRPYQASPCGNANKARFCSNTLTFFESFDVTGKGDCVKKDQQGSFHCNPQNGGNVMGRVEPHDLYVELTDSNFPIFGNTEDSLDDAQKVNEYASWYLSGVNDKLENKDATEEQIVNFSGPVKKLIPSMIQDAQRIKIIESATKETTYVDEQTGEKVTEAENHNQKVVDNERLSSWEGDLSFIRSAIDSSGNGLTGALLGGIVTNELNNIGVDLSIKAGWNKRIPPLPWSDENGQPFESDILYQKAYQEWQGKSCAILPIIGLQCIDNPFISNKYADLWHYVPLSNNSDKKGANYLLTDDGPNYVPSQGTEIENAFHETYTNANLYFAHTQEVKDLEELLNSTYRPSGYKSEPIPETTEEIKRGINTAVGDSAHTNHPAYEGLDCSNLVVRTNKGDDLFPGDPKELTVKGVTYTITGAECEEVFKEVKDCNHPPRSNPCGGDPNSGACCMVKKTSLKCIAEVGIVLQLGTKTPWAKEIYADTVADSGSSFRKIFPKVEEGAPVSCIADIPAVTTVTYDATKSEKPKGGDQTFKVKNIPFDGGSEGTELTFAHVGSVYEYFLKGIQTALRPKGYGDEIISAAACRPTVEQSCDVQTPDSAVPSKYLGQFKENFISLADRWSQKCPGPENNMADECYNYIASTAQKGGVNPAFALTIWLNESGASNYCEGGNTTQDMGINIPAYYLNLPKQIETFIKMAKTKLCSGDSGFSEPMHGWLSRFQSSKGICDPADETATQYYNDVMNTTWSWVSGCTKNGKFGINWPTDMNCP